jgi:hypothetical protein
VPAITQTRAAAAHYSAVDNRTPQRRQSRDDAHQARSGHGRDAADAVIAKITRPLLAFFGTSGDVGQAELTVVASTSRRLATGPRRIDTATIARGDHMYAGEEAQVAQVIADWLDRAVAPSAATATAQPARP